MERLTALTTSGALAGLPKLAPLDYRIPRWAPEDLAPRLCPFCGAWREAILRRPDDLPVAYCAACAVWYVSSIPTPERLVSFYQGYWRSFRPARLDARTARVMTRTARENARADVRISRLTAILATLDGRRVVDIGCGLGSFLLSLQVRGAEPLGVEISEEARDFVQQYLGLLVYGDLSGCLAEAGPVDAIVLNDLVQHLVEPAQFLETAVRSLREGGVISIWTPNGGAAGQDLNSAREWVGFRVDLEHLQYLSPRAIVLLAGKLGLTVEHLETTGFPGLTGIDRPPVALCGSGGNCSTCEPWFHPRASASWRERCGRRRVTDARRRGPRAHITCLQSSSVQCAHMGRHFAAGCRSEITGLAETGLGYDR